MVIAINYYLIVEISRIFLFLFFFVVFFFFIGRTRERRRINTRCEQQIDLTIAC